MVCALAAMLTACGSLTQRTADERDPASDAAAPSAGAARPAAAQASEDPATLSAIAAALTRAPAGADSVWPGFALSEPGVLVYEPAGDAVLVTAHAPPPGFEPFFDRGGAPQSSGPATRVRAYRHRGALPALTGGINIRYRLGTFTVAAVPRTKQTLGVALLTIYHEAFHTHQGRRFDQASRRRGEFVDPALITPAFAAMAEVERRLLGAALGRVPGPERDSVARDYLAVYRARLQTLPPEAVAVVRELARKEGSAQLVGYQSAAAALGLPASRVVRAVQRDLTERLARFGGGSSARLVRWHAYGAGAAVGLLLDGTTDAWRRSLEGGAALDELLAAAVAFDTAGAATRARRALERHGYDQMRTARRPPWGPLGAGLTVEKFYRLAPVRLVVEIPEPERDPKISFTIDFRRSFLDILRNAPGGKVDPEPGITLWPDPSLVTLQGDPQATFEVKGRPVLVDVRQAPASLRLTVLLPARPTVNGAPLSERAARELPGLALAGRGTTLRVRRPVNVTAAGDSVVVRLRR